MDLKYDADSGKVIDGDVRLETMEDLEREMKQSYEEIFALQESIKRTKSGVSDKIGLARWKDKWEQRKIDHIRDRKVEIKKYERILESLLTLKRSRFG